MMKKFIPFVVLCIAATPAMALTPAGQGRRATAHQMNAPRATASVNQLNAMASMASMSVGADSSVSKPSIKVDTPEATIPTEEEKKDMREKEKAACINNNIGVGNTFVWASRYSNINNYASMVEDVDEPENNTCFVRVEMKSDDAKVSVADIPAKYFEMGQTITCGSWADEKSLEKRILDAKKTARTWGTVGGAVGGAALGVGAMELFGNKLIGGSVQGQKALKDNELLYSQLAVLKKNDSTRYGQIMEQIKSLKSACEAWDKISGDAERPKECTEINYDYLLSLDSAL